MTGSPKQETKLCICFTIFILLGLHGRIYVRPRASARAGTVVASHRPTGVEGSKRAEGWTEKMENETRKRAWLGG